MRLRLARLLESANGMYVVVFSGMMLVTVLFLSAAGLWADIPWAALTRVSALAAGVPAAFVSVHRIAPWLSWAACGGVLIHGLIAVAGVYYGFAVLLHVRPGGSVSVYLGWLALAWSSMSFVALVGILRNAWWGYYGEAALVCVACLSALAPSGDRSVGFFVSYLLPARLMCHLIGVGKVRRILSRYGLT